MYGPHRTPEFVYSSGFPFETYILFTALLDDTGMNKYEVGVRPIQGRSVYAYVESDLQDYNHTILSVKSYMRCGDPIVRREAELSDPVNTVLRQGAQSRRYFSRTTPRFSK